VTIDLSKCDLCEECVAACPRDVLSKKDNKLVVTGLESCILCSACVTACPKEAITTHGDNSKFIFEFETDGSLTARDTLRKALEILEKRFDDFREDVGQLIDG